jgi:glycosyltransferase involved in cell wall biosynthesis
VARCDADFPVEVLLVDNNSNDGTGPVAQQIWKEAGNPAFAFRVIYEPRQGLSFARRAGVQAAQGEIIVFCDDDNWLAPDYLTIARNIMLDDRVGAAGGQSQPVIDGEVPSFLYSHGIGYALGVQALKSGDVTARGYLWGSGLVVRREEILTLYSCPGFPVLLGRNGARLTSGEDSEICAGLILLGKRLWYDDQLRFRHWIAPARLSFDYLVQLYEEFAATADYSQYYDCLQQLCFRSAVFNVFVNFLKYLRSLGEPSVRAKARFIILSELRLVFLMNTTERQFYGIYRYLSEVRLGRRRVPLAACLTRHAVRDSLSTEPTF